MKKKILYSLVLVLIFTACGNSSSDSKNVSDLDKKDLPHLTNETFKEKIWDYIASPQEWVFEGEKPVVIDFYADWCRPCQKIAPIMKELAEQYDGKIKVYKINVDEEKELTKLLDIKGIPAVLFIPKEGKPVMKSGALYQKAYHKLVNELLIKELKN